MAIVAASSAETDCNLCNVCANAICGVMATDALTSHACKLPMLVAAAFPLADCKDLSWAAVAVSMMAGIPYVVGNGGKGGPAVHCRLTGPAALEIAEGNVGRGGAAVD